MAPDPSPARDDDALVGAAGRGDQHAYRLLVEAWAPRVHAFLVRALTNRADADDLTQETFVRVWRAAPRYAAQGLFQAWLFRIAGNLARQELRRRRVRGWFVGASATGDDDVLVSLPAPRAFDPEGPLRDAEVRRALALALARLPDRQRLAILLRHFEGMSGRDVAAVLGTSEHATESLLARATAALRAALAGHAGD